MTESASQALAILRDGSQFQWYVVVLLAFAFYVYAVEAEKRNWSLVLAGLAFWGMDWFNEIWNGLVMHFTGFAPVWGAPGKTAYLLLVGLNIEIMFMFAVSGIIWTKMLLPDRKTKILGLPNRWFVPIAGSAFCVFYEDAQSQTHRGRDDLVRRHRLAHPLHPDPALDLKFKRGSNWQV